MRTATAGRRPSTCWASRGASHPGHLYSRAQLLDAVWGDSHEGYEHTVTTHINRLRATLEQDPMQPRFVLTVRGAGYKMRDAPSDGSGTVRPGDRVRDSVAPASSEHGKGPGLAIVKRIVELHRGTVAVQSEAGRGTTVAIELPAA